jgi:hypothetical protein
VRQVIAYGIPMNDVQGACLGKRPAVGLGWRHSRYDFLQAIENRCVEELLTACWHDEEIELASTLVLE